MAGDEHQTQQVVAHVIVERRVEVGRGRLLFDLELMAELLVLPFEQLAAAEEIDGAVLRRGHEPRARVVAGLPASGHCWSAATSASCARSSATPTSRTIRARPAMSLGDSILQTASIVRCVSVAATAPNHITPRGRGAMGGMGHGRPWRWAIQPIPL